MSYVDDNLSPGEQVRYRAAVHWSIYVVAAFVLALGIVICLIQIFNREGSVFYLIPFIGFVLLVKDLLYAKTTELAITNQRIIAKTGFMQRNTIEQRLEKVDNVRVHQGVLQRIFNAGTVNITGSGASQTPIKNIENPLYFRREVNNAIDDLDQVSPRSTRRDQ